MIARSRPCGAESARRRQTTPDDAGRRQAMPGVRRRDRRLAGTSQLRHVPGAMRSTWTTLVLVTLVVGCEHKSKKDDKPADKPVMGSASGAAKPAAGEMKPEPVGKDPNARAAETPPPGVA